MSTIPAARLLDVRESSEALARPILGAANIPLSELAARSHELPTPGTPIQIAADHNLSPAAADWLAAGGRSSEAVAFSYSSSPQCPARLWSPNGLVEAAVDDLPCGRALDLACGAGRDAVYLAFAGWNVVAVDRLADALDRGRLTADRFGCAERIDWVCADLHSFVPQGGFDLVVMAFYFNQAVLARACAVLNTGGVVLLETFTPTHRSAHGKPRNPGLTLSAAEVPNLLTGFEVLLCEESWRGEKHTLRLVARKS